MKYKKNSPKISTEENEFLKHLSINERLRQMLVGENGVLAKLSNSPMERIEAADLSYHLGIIDQIKLEQIYKEAAIFVWNNASFTVNKINLMKKLGLYLSKVSTSDLIDKAWLSTKIWDLISLHKSSDQDFLAMAISNLDITMTSALNEYSKRVANLEEVKVNNGGESIVNIRKLQIEVQKENIDTLCKQIHNLNISKTEVILKFQSSAENIKNLNLKYCNKLLDNTKTFNTFRRI